MDAILQYLDVIIATLVGGLVTLGISSLSHRRNEKKERLEREREYVDQYIELFMAYEVDIVRYLGDFKNSLPEEKKDNHFINLPDVEKFDREKEIKTKAFLAKSYYSLELDDLLAEDTSLERFGDKIDLMREENFETNSDFKKFIQGMISEVEEIFDSKRRVIREFYNEKF